MSAPVTPIVLASWRRYLGQQKRDIEAALAQLDDAGWRRRVHPDVNSVAIIVNHLAGSMLSRFTDFLTTDGEKPWRDREAEFRDAAEPRAAVMARWEKAWGTVFAALDALTEEDLLRTVTIRGEPHTVPEAIGRVLVHAAYHAGQILMLARLVRGSEWTWVTIPPGGSAAHNEAVARRHGRGASSAG